MNRWKMTVLLLAVLCLLSGCGAGQKRLRVVLTGGLSGNELFRVEKEALTVPEARILLMTELSGYRNLYGETMLSRTFGEQTLEESIKESTLALLGKIVMMDQMAVKYQIALSPEEETRVKDAAAEYYSSLNETEKAFAKANEKDVETLLGRIVLADRVFEELTADADIEVSDDEARVVTIRHIMVKKSKEAYTKLLDVFDQLQQGADFDAMAEKYNEDTQEEYTVGRGELDKELEKEAFRLETGEMSPIVESADGYHILLCVDNFDREATEQNKKKLLTQRKWEAFEETYNAFAREQTCELKEKRWKEISLDKEEISNTSFYDIYRKYFAS